ncbi:hypothetical protein EfmAA96_22560 [Enterococcus faecium]|nr:hypothetical protein EfmAA96_22560 [Enterococcus faecium]
MVPLVPGGLAYQAVRNLVTESYREAAHYAVQAIMIAGAIALGLVLSEVFNHNIRNFKVKRDAIMMKRKNGFLIPPLDILLSKSFHTTFQHTC